MNLDQYLEDYTTIRKQKVNSCIVDLKSKEYKRIRCVGVKNSKFTIITIPKLNELLKREIKYFVCRNTYIVYSVPPDNNSKRVGKRSVFKIDKKDDLQVK